jgi:hypothetical protein
MENLATLRSLLGLNFVAGIILHSTMNMHRSVRVSSLKHNTNMSILLMLLGLMMILLIPQDTSAQLANKVVKVTGYGDSINEARSDAVRQALQETMQQLIVVDRAIKDDKLVRDKIMSTMNGYIESFKELSVNKEGQQIALTAEIIVSPSRIENFIGTNIGGGSNIAGAALFADSQREIAQRKARGEIFDRLFRGFPSEVTEVRLLKISPSPDLQFYIVDIELSFTKPWLDALRSGLKALATGSNKRKSDDELVFIIEKGNTYSPQTYILPPGEYGTQIYKSIVMQLPGINSVYIYGGDLLVAMQFTDEKGNSGSIENKCFDFLNYSDRQLISQESIKGTGSSGVSFFSFRPVPERETNFPHWTLNINPVIRHIKIPVNKIDVSAVKNVAFLPYLNLSSMFRNRNIVMDLMATEPVSDVCGEPMDRVVQRLMMLPKSEKATVNTETTASTGLDKYIPSFLKKKK